MNQLRIDGGEDPTDMIVGSLRPTSRAIIRHILEHGSISAVEAGCLVHAGRRTWSHSTEGLAQYREYHPASKGCCAYAASDGSDALRKLRDRGLVERTEDAWIVRPPA